MNDEIEDDSPRRIIRELRAALAAKKLYVLRATKTETYDCPDNGMTNICERYEDVQFATAPEALNAMAEDLNKGHVGYWTEKRAKELRSLHSGYDTHDNYTYAVHDVSNLFTETTP